MRARACILASSLALTLAAPVWAGEGDELPPPPVAAPATEESKPAALPPAAPPPAVPEAQSGLTRRRTITDNDWRRRARRRSDSKASGLIESTHFVFELRFGPYSPQVDEEFGGSGPFTRFFGDDPRFYFGMELDWLPLHIPYVGSIGAAYGWGYVHASGKTRLLSDPTKEAGSDTALNIFPMHLSGVVRVDGPLRRLGFPIVPYAKLGIGMGVWNATGPDGTSTVDGVSGDGTSFGLHVALGGALALNAFDPTSAIAMQEETGIRYAYLYGEWMNANLDGIGSTPQMHVGTSTVVLGLALDF